MHSGEPLGHLLSDHLTSIGQRGRVRAGRGVEIIAVRRSEDVKRILSGVGQRDG